MFDDVSPKMALLLSIAWWVTHSELRPFRMQYREFTKSERRPVDGLDP